MYLNSLQNLQGHKGRENGREREWQQHSSLLRLLSLPSIYTRQVLTDEPLKRTHAHQPQPAAMHRLTLLQLPYRI
jgi:hypothetical protein